MAKGMVLKFDDKKIKEVEKGIGKMSKTAKNQLVSMEAGVSRDARKKAVKKAAKKK